MKALDRAIRMCDEYKRKIVSINKNPGKDTVVVKFRDDDGDFEEEYYGINKTMNLLKNDKSISNPQAIK